jgi:hypothetical protein
MIRWIVSPQFGLVKEDWLKWGKNALIFAGPALLVLIASVVQAVPADFKYGVVALYILNTLTDLLRKFLAESKYQK